MKILGVFNLHSLRSADAITITLDESINITENIFCNIKMANWNQLPIDIQKEITRDLPISARARLYQTSSQMSKIPYDCCFEPTMKEIIAYLVQQAKLLQNPKTRHLTTLKFPSNMDRIPLFFTNKLGEFFIVMFIDGSFLYSCRKIPINELVSLLSSPDIKISRRFLFNSIRIIRPVLHNRLSCMKQNSDFADKCFLQLLPNYVNADDYWIPWVGNIKEISNSLLYDPEILYAAVDNESHKWNRSNEKLSIRSLSNSSRTQVDGILVRQWLTNWLLNLPVSELKPLISN